MVFLHFPFRQIKVTVEPVLFCLFFSLTLSGAVLTNLILARTCSIELNLNHTTCALLENKSEEAAKDVEAMVQPHAATLIMIRGLLQSILPAFLCLFLGPWSDRNGRRKLIYFPILGFAMMNVVLGIFSYFRNIPTMYILLAIIPQSFSGGAINCIFSCFCYISDISKEDDRTIRMALVDGALYFGMVVGMCSSSYVLSAGGEYGYILIFVISSIADMTAFTYAYFFLPETIHRNEESKGFKVIFKTEYVTDIIKTCFKKGENSERTIRLLMTLAILASFMPIHGEMNVEYLFTRLQFGWNIRQQTTFDAAFLVMKVVGTVLGSVVLAKYMKISDIFTVIIGTFMKTAICVFYALIPANASYLMYVGAAFGSLVSVSGPAARSLLSKCVAKEDIGKMFSLTFAAESFLPLVAHPLYTGVYNASLNVLPGAFWFLSAFFAFFVTVIYAIIGCILNFQAKKSKEKVEGSSHL